MKYGDLFKKFLRGDNIEKQESTIDEETKEEEQEVNQEKGEENELQEKEQEQQEQQQEEEKIKIKLDGSEIELEKDDLNSFIKDAIEYRELKTKDEYDVFQEAKDLSKEDVLLLKEVLNGNAGALKALLEKANVNLDELDLDGIDKFEPTQDENPLSKTVRLHIEQLAQKDNTIYDKLNESIEQLDDRSLLDITSNDNKHIAFVEAVAAGEFQKYLPEAKIIRAKNPALSTLEAWAIAYNNKNKPKQQQKQEPKNTHTELSNENNDDDSSTYNTYFKKFLED